MGVAEVASADVLSHQDARRRPMPVAGGHSLKVVEDQVLDPVVLVLLDPPAILEVQ